MLCRFNVTVVSNSRLTFIEHIEIVLFRLTLAFTIDLVIYNRSFICKSDLREFWKYYSYVFLSHINIQSYSKFNFDFPSLIWNVLFIFNFIYINFHLREITKLELSNICGLSQFIFYRINIRLNNLYHITCFCLSLTLSLLLALTPATPITRPLYRICYHCRAYCDIVSVAFARLYSVITSRGTSHIFPAIMYYQRSSVYFCQLKSIYYDVCFIQHLECHVCN